MNTPTSPATGLAASVLAAGALAASAAQAAPIHVEVSGTAQVLEVLDTTGPVLRFGTQAAGSGDFGLVSYLSTDVVDMATGRGTGTNRFVAHNGDELLGEFEVQVIPGSSPGLVSVQGLTRFVGGTGLFAGARGSATLSGSGQFVSETRALVQFVHDGQLQLVPEPSSAALVAAAAAAAVAAARKRA